jgi:hypothetical protein
MIQDESWIRRQVIDLWFDCWSQEQIASFLGVSLGKVNSIIQEYTKSHEWASKIRDVVNSAKKNGVDINQIISNDRFVNAVKKFGSDNDKLELLLKGLGQIISQNDGDPTIAAAIIYEILEIVYKLHKSPSEILEELESYTEKRRIAEDQIQVIQTELKNNNVTIADIRICKEFMDNLKNCGVSDMDKANNFLKNVREQGGDPQKLVKVLSRYSSVKYRVNRLEGVIFENMGFLDDLTDTTSTKREATEIIERIYKMGFSEQSILNVLKVIEDFLLEYRDSPGGNILVAQLRQDLRIYGSLSAANIYLKFRNRDLNSKVHVTMNGQGLGANAAPAPPTNNFR